MSASGSTSSSASGDSTSSTGPSEGTDTVALTTGGTGGAQEDTCVAGVNLWTLDAHFDQGVLSNVNHDAPNDDQLQVTIEGVSAPKPYLFIAQTFDGRILKIDTETGDQLARYDSTLLADCPGCTVDRTLWRPSRLVVDFEGDMYVANRAFANQGSLTKIAGSLAGCVDRDGDGEIETSSDLNGDGVIDHHSADEFKGQGDECVLWTVPIGGIDSLPRAVALDLKGSLYVGAYNEKKVYKLDLSSAPPKVVDTIGLPGSPYGFALRGNFLYASTWGKPVMRIDLTTDEIKTMTAPGNYGVTVDQGGVAWYGGSGLWRCDFDAGDSCQDMGGGFPMNGVAIDGDGQIWTSGSNRVFKFSAQGALLGSVDAAGAYGVSIGHDGDPRVIAHYDAYRVEAGPVGGPPGAVTPYYTGLFSGSKVANYTYSDYTGFSALNVTVRNGEWTVIHDSGDPAAVWEKVPWNTEPEGDIPPGTSITVQVRAAATEEQLAATPFAKVVDGSIAGDVAGRFVEIKARLVIEDEAVDVSPVFSDVCVLRQPG